MKHLYYIETKKLYIFLGYHGIPQSPSHRKGRPGSALPEEPQHM